MNRCGQKHKKYTEPDFMEVNMKANKMDHPNGGISCEVTTCSYYMNGDYCSADKIQVTPRNARTVGETDCSTFTPKG